MPTFDSDRRMTVHGVPGRLTHRTTKPGQAPGLWMRQRWISEARPIKGYGPGAIIRAEMRFDDQCGNGHNSFAITGQVTTPARESRGLDVLACGCIHDEIAEAFPELARFIPWHLFDSTGPMHYISNTLYLAGDADHWGKRAGEPASFGYAVQFGENPIKHVIKCDLWDWLKDNADGGAFPLHVVIYQHEPRPGYDSSHKFAPKFTYSTRGNTFGSKWHECPFDTEQAARDFLAALQTCRPQFLKIPLTFSEGKPRELDAARRVAVWPEATDEELSRPRDELKAALEARLPGLVERFRAEMIGAGFVWAPEDMPADEAAPAAD